ncbi:unnamed protein product [Arctogadus glacialis]
MRRRREEEELEAWETHEGGTNTSLHLNISSAKPSCWGRWNHKLPAGSPRKTGREHGWRRGGVERDRPRRDEDIWTEGKELGAKRGRDG